MKPDRFSRNRKLWVTKIRKTIQRDKIVTRSLRRKGWKVLRFWDSEIAKTPEKVVKKIKFAMSEMA
jgi:DNA mismatch endonuclease (patch repair protein)